MVTWVISAAISAEPASPDYGDTRHYLMSTAGEKQQHTLRIGGIHRLAHDFSIAGDDGIGAQNDHRRGGRWLTGKDFFRLFPG